MAGLKSLIRLRKHELDEKRQAVAKFIAMLDNLRREEVRALNELDAEKKEAESNLETRQAFPNYNKRIQAKLKALREEQIKVSRAIEKAQAELQDSFKEYKTYEITQRERERAEAAEEKRVEDQAMDEIGIEGFRRRDK